MEQVQITKAGLADAEAITGLVNRAYRPAPGAEGWTHESALVSGSRVSRENVVSAIQGSTILIGSRGQVPLGCVQIEMKGSAAHIGMLAVDPSLQAGGIGTWLLQQAEEFSTQECRAEIAVLIVIAARKELVQFYLRRGYRKTEEQLQYPINAGVGTPVEEAMLLTKLEKCFNNRLHDRFPAGSQFQTDA